MHDQCALLDVLVEDVLVVVVVGGHAHEHLVEEHTDQIPVYWFAMPLPSQHLR